MLLGARNYLATYEDWGLCFTAESPGVTISMSKYGTPPDVTLQTSRNGWSWKPFIVGTSSVTLDSIGDKVYFSAGPQGNNSFSTPSNYYQFVIDGGFVSASGDVTSLLSFYVSKESLTDMAYVFTSLFKDCINLKSAPSLPSKKLVNNCYNLMFSGCKNLVDAPALPAIDIGSGCYNSMFSNCTNLINVPSLPARTVYSYSYYAMFYGCTSIETAPALQAPILSNSCYQRMFYGCTHLTSVPLLEATTLANNSCTEMFYNCKALNHLEVSFKAFNPSSATTNWLYGVKTPGTFICPQELEENLPDPDASHVPVDWNVNP